MPVIHKDSATQITIDWGDSINATRNDTLRYIVDVRGYVSGGPGRERTQSISGYPLELPSSRLQYVVRSLSEFFFKRINAMLTLIFLCVQEKSYCMK